MWQRRLCGALFIALCATGCSDEEDEQSQDMQSSRDMGAEDMPDDEDQNVAPDLSDTREDMDSAADQGSEDMPVADDMNADLAPDMPPLKALGEGCELGEDCESGACAESPFGGVCGECVDDTDCEWGCEPPPIMGIGDVGPSMCHDGGAGSRCQDDDACLPELGCGRNPLTLPIGNQELGTCNACDQDADCEAGSRCAIVNEGTVLSFACVPEGSVPDGSLCDLEGSGDEACQGLCAEASVMGPVTLTLGVCSACREDSDCETGQTCTPPSVDLMMAAMPVPGQCE